MPRNTPNVTNQPFRQGKVRKPAPGWRQNLRTLAITTSLGGILAYGLSMLPLPVAAEGETQPSPKEKSSSASPQPPARQANTSEAATAYVAEAHRSLANRRSIQAAISQVVAINGTKLELKGRYVNSGLKLRLELATRLPGGSEGRLLEVCDGNVLWSQMDLIDTHRVTRRDVRQILAAVSAGSANPQAILTAELGLGGIPGLLAGLQQDVDFQELSELPEEDVTRVLVRGVWKPAFLQKIGAGRELPPYIPEQIQIVFHPTTLVPEEIRYLKAVKEGGTQTLVVLKFHEVLLDEAVHDQLFLFMPPEDIVPEDVTRQYVEQISKSKEAPATNTP